YTQSQDIGRRALELSGGVGIRAQKEWWGAEQSPAICRGVIQERTGAGQRGAVGDDDLCPARYWRCSFGVGKRSAPCAEGFGQRQLRVGDTVADDPGRATSGISGQGREKARHAGGWRSIP